MLLLDVESIDGPKGVFFPCFFLPACRSLSTVASRGSGDVPSMEPINFFVVATVIVQITTSRLK